MRLMVYSHDAFGLGNIRRMLEICQYLLKSLPNLSILLVSGSPMLQSFRLPAGLDYIKLPCLNRGESGQLSSKYLPMDAATTLKLRSEVLLTAALNFKPDLVLVDKKPFGLKGELTETLAYLSCYLPQTRLVLLLRDILDAPEITQAEWQQQSCYQAIEDFYNQVLVVGMPEIFQLCQEYEFSDKATRKVRYCGYIRKQVGNLSPAAVREELQLLPEQPLVVVTPGGGEDGFPITQAYLQGLAALHNPGFASLIITGPEMPDHQRQQLADQASQLEQVQVLEFTPELMSYIQAASLVVCMSGYNTITEVLSLGKRAIVVPRHKPGQEQLIRAQRMAELGLLRMIHPDVLSSEHLLAVVQQELATVHNWQLPPILDLQGLDCIAEQIHALLPQSCPIPLGTDTRTVARAESSQPLSPQLPLSA